MESLPVCVLPNVVILTLYVHVVQLLLHQTVQNLVQNKGMTECQYSLFYSSVVKFILCLVLLTLDQVCKTDCNIDRLH